MSRKMILSILAGSLCLASVVAVWWTNRAPQRVFSESMLQTWGYTTSSIDDHGHHVRSVKNYGSKDEAFFARFTLKVSETGSEAEAASEMQRIQKEAGEHISMKDYRQVIQDRSRLIVVTPTSNYTRLEHQPKLLAEIRKHLGAGDP